VKNLINVEIDERVVDITRKYIGVDKIVDEAIKEKKFELIIGDGCAYVQESADKTIQFDGIIIDCTDVFEDEAISLTLFSEKFYKNIRKTLKKNARMSQQVGSQEFVELFTKLVKTGGFSTVEYVTCETPEYGGLTVIGVAPNNE
jgi:spermidine synthase